MRTVGLTTLGVLLLAANVRASVTSASPDGFTLEHTVEVDSSATAAFQTFVGRIAVWWDPAHTYSGKSENMSIDARPNGCFCEKLGTGGIAHMAVLYVDPGKILRMRGELGPLQEMGVSGVLSLTFAEAGNKTKVQMKYAVSGRSALALDKLAPLVDGVMVAQMTRFQRFASTGKP